MNKTSAIVFFGIILIGFVLSLLYFSRGPGKPDPAAEVAPEEVASVAATSEAPDGEEGATSAPPDAVPSVEAPADSPERSDAPASASADGTFDSPAAALSALRDTLSERRYDLLVEFVGPEAVPEAKAAPIRSLVEAPDFSLAADPPFREVSKSAGASRWSIEFISESDAGAEARQIYVDLETLDDERVAFTGLSLPLELPVAAREGETETEADREAAAEAVAELLAPGVDPLTIAHAFSKAVVGRNFPAARALADSGSVTDERVAALMIAVEEGGFNLRDDRPLVVTLSREDLTWVLARIQSTDSSSEFALELGRSDESWKVNGLTFSKVLSALASKAGGGDVAYSPIVENPEGGDSLVLYFEFDDASINERGMRQLSVIAEILKQGEERVIRINGHADALGSDQYNKVLSDRRAGAIREGLISFGVSPRQVVTEAYGDTRPRRPNFNPDGTDNPSGRSENRRAEVYLDF